MSSVKMTRLFHQAGYPSTEICQCDTPISRALKDQGLRSIELETKNYVSPRATLSMRKTFAESEAAAVFLHSMKDIWLVTPALWGRPTKLFGFARMFFKDISKKDLGHTIMYSRIDKMIALSQIQKRHLMNCLPISEDKFVVIPNGVDTDRFQPRPKREDIRAGWGIKSEEVLFGLIGRLDRQKGSVEFVQAAAEVLKHHPHCRFVMVGGNTLGESEIDLEVRNLLRNLNLEDKVRLTDFRTDVPDIMNALDVFVMPSYEENFANVLLEALASGLPSISTDSGGTPEILSFGEVGRLCEPKSYRALAQAMDAMIREPGLRQTLATKAREKALREYKMSEVFKKIESLVTT